MNNLIYLLLYVFNTKSLNISEIFCVTFDSIYDMVFYNHNRFFITGIKNKKTFSMEIDKEYLKVIYSPVV